MPSLDQATVARLGEEGLDVRGRRCSSGHAAFAVLCGRPATDAVARSCHAFARAHRERIAASEHVRGLFLDGERKSIAPTIPRVPNWDERTLRLFVN